MKFKFNKFIDSLIWMFTGSLISMILLDIRFKNPLLRRELILEMQSGASYFSMFVILDIFMLIVLYGFYFWNNRRKK